MDRFVFPKSFYESIKTFKPASREALYSAIFGYIFDDAEPVFSKEDVKRVWILISPILSKAKKISDTMSRQSQENVGRMSRDTKDNLKTNLSPSPFKEKDKEKDKDIKEKDYKEKRSAAASPVIRFIKPTVDQVRAYISEKHYHFDAESFIAFYESKGWRVGNTPMKSWQAACVTWEKRNAPVEVEPEKEEKPVPKVTQCPECGSYDLRMTLDRVMCKSCGAMYDYNHAKGKWEKSL